MYYKPPLVTCVLQTPPLDSPASGHYKPHPVIRIAVKRVGQASLAASWKRLWGGVCRVEKKALQTRPQSLRLPRRFRLLCRRKRLRVSAKSIAGRRKKSAGDFLADLMDSVSSVTGVRHLPILSQKVSSGPKLTFLRFLGRCVRV